jgi:hypothetical protein
MASACRSLSTQNRRNSMIGVEYGRAWIKIGTCRTNSAGVDHF